MKTILLFKVSISYDLTLIIHEVFDIFYSGFCPVLVEDSLSSLIFCKSCSPME